MVQFCCGFNTAEECQSPVAKKVKIFIVNFMALVLIIVITKTVLSCIHSLDEDLKQTAEFPSLSS